MPLNDNENGNRNIMFAVTTVVVAIIVVLLVWSTTGPKTTPSEVAAPPADTADNSIGTTTAGNVQVGNGDYTLTDINGQTVTQDSFPGKFKLVFFGYTNCPDECPATLQKMTTALSTLGEDANRVQPLFITIDPARDTPEQLRGYLANFNPNILGLTGTPDQVKQASNVFRAYYSPAPGAEPAAMNHDMAPTAADKMASATPPGASAVVPAPAPAAATDMVEHSAFVYLLSPSNELVTVLDNSRAPDDMAQTIRAALNAAPTDAGTAGGAPAATSSMAPSSRNSMSTDTPEETPATDVVPVKPATTAPDSAATIAPAPDKTTETGTNKKDTAIPGVPVPGAAVPGASKVPAEVVEPHNAMPQGEPIKPLAK